ncbi:hypothetical protein UlMin_028512 [Ulmus minor]
MGKALTTKNSKIRIIRLGFEKGLVYSVCDLWKLENRARSHSCFARSVGGFGFQCGLVAGIFSLTRCGLQRYRRKSDLVNGLIAGAVAGAAVAARTRSLTQVLGTTCLVSAFSAAADYSRSI